MTAATQSRQTEHKYVERARYLPVAADICYDGTLAMVVRNTGYAGPAMNTAGGVVLGVFQEKVDNRGGSPGDLSAEVRPGIYKFVNSSTNPVAQQHVGSPCFVEDDQTVADEAGGGKVVAGIVEEIDSDGGIWVSVGLENTALALLVSDDEVVTSDALSLFTRTSYVSVTGAQAFSLAAGLYEGQRKSIRCTVAASSPDGTLTPSVFAHGSTITFDALHEFVELEWHDADGWNLVHFSGATINA